MSQKWDMHIPKDSVRNENATHENKQDEVARCWAYTCNPRTRTEAGGCYVPDQHGLHSKSLR